MRYFLLVLFAVLFMSISAIHAQSAQTESLYWSSGEDGPSLEFELKWKPFALGNAYVETQIGSDGFEIYGYSYQNVYYDYGELSDYGITFPIYSKGYARIAADARITSGYRCGFESIELDSRLVYVDVKTSFDLDAFSSSIKQCLDDHRRATGETWEEFVDFYNIRVLEVIVEVRLDIENAIRQKLNDENLQNNLKHRREVLWDTFKEVCYENYNDYETIKEALSDLSDVVANKSILQSWQQNAVDDCYNKLNKRANNLLLNDTTGDDSYSIDNLFNAALIRARNAEANGDYYTALQEYKTAYSLSNQNWLSDKISEMEQRTNAQAMVAGATTFISGMNEEFSDLGTGRMNGAFVFSINYTDLNFGVTDGLSGMQGGGLGVFAKYDHTFWLGYKKQFGFHLGLNGSASGLWDAYEGSNSFTDGYNSQPSKWDLGFFGGFNFFGRLEIDYFMRGLSIKGEYSAEDPNSIQGRLDQPIGGNLHFDSGLKTSFYFFNQIDFFIRGSAWYIDALADSQVKFLDNDNNKEVQTVSYGYRIELIKRPWSFILFSQHDAYYTTEALNIGLNYWGIGVGFGGGTSY